MATMEYKQIQVTAETHKNLQELTHKLSKQLDTKVSMSYAIKLSIKNYTKTLDDLSK